VDHHAADERQARDVTHDIQEPDEAERIEAGRRLFAQDCAFVAGATSIEILPPPTLPEIAFAGRSNVGKSSLVNALTGRSTLARTSKDPGRTQQINFFALGGRLMLVDMPGYGFARVGKKQIQGWTRLTKDYLKGRPNLRRALVLIDSRHGLKDTDRETMKLLDEAAVSFQIILTKTDQLKADELTAQIARVGKDAAQYTAAHPEIAATSARTGQGIPELRAALAAMAALS
jgi:GTP-binding protein